MKIPQPVKWDNNRAKKWVNWLIRGNDTRTAKDKFLESRAGIFPNKEHGLSLEDQKIIQPNY
jgi:hypothetical protein